MSAMPNFESISRRFTSRIDEPDGQPRFYCGSLAINDTSLSSDLRDGTANSGEQLHVNSQSIGVLLSPLSGITGLPQTVVNGI